MAGLREQPCSRTVPENKEAVLSPTLDGDSVAWVLRAPAGPQARAPRRASTDFRPGAQRPLYMLGKLSRGLRDSVLDEAQDAGSHPGAPEPELEGEASPTPVDSQSFMV
ncbi:hypothetical protein NDU88_002330 [Pleurodeles waltl]|uniref:Uncharacterized protein n=1 Tax=Pleurodeles waltl TaxID=8319 RepID=A0AAV7LFM7_PLEWA|nr:hypothetical protein NDU88_002330 [Pleurodeles waltl]